MNHVMPKSFSERIAPWLLAGRWPLLLLAMLAAAVSFLPARNVTFDRSIENMFAPDDPLLAALSAAEERLWR